MSKLLKKLVYVRMAARVVRFLLPHVRKYLSNRRSKP
jgi:hypothetical protein